MPNTLQNYRLILQASKPQDEINRGLLSESDQYTTYINKVNADAPLDEKVADEKKEELQNHTEINSALINRTHHSSRIRHLLLTELEAYASVNLVVEEKAVVNAYFVPAERANAYVKLKAVLTQELGWDEFFTLYDDPVFEEEAGIPTGEGEERYVPRYSLWDTVHRAHTLLTERDTFFRQFSDNTLLRNTISQDHLYTLFDQDDFALIFQYSNRALFLELLDKHKRLEEWKPIQVTGQEPLDAKLIDTMQSKQHADLKVANDTRRLYQVPYRIPGDYLRSEQFEQLEALPAVLTYQFSLNDMQAAEAQLISTYNHLLVKGDNEIGESKGDLGSQFSYIPLHLNPVVVQPSNHEHAQYQQYLDFKAGLQHLIQGYRPGINTTPLVFFGLMHMNGQDYLPYFISKSPDNRIHIAVIESSLPTHEWNSEENKRACRKYQLHQTVKNIIQDIFPRCTLTIPVISQELRRCDNVPNSLIVLEDALLTSEDAKPFIKMDNHRLVLNTAALSVNLNAMQLNAEQAYYLNYSLRITSLYRRLWMERLNLQQQMCSMLSLSEKTASVRTHFFRFMERYQYDAELDDPNDMIQLYLNSTVYGLYFDELPLQSQNDLRSLLAMVILMPDECKSFGLGSHKPSDVSSDEKSAPAERNYQMGEFSNLIRISHLEDAIAMYKKVKTQNSFNDYREKIRTQFPEEKSLDNTLFQGGIFRSFFQAPSTDIVLLDGCVQSLRRRNPVEDFLLERQDVESLVSAISQRWGSLKYDSAKPQNYFDLGSSTDRTYLLMATLAKQAFKNMNVKASAFQILMPERAFIVADVREMKEDLEGVYLPSNEIDDFSFKHVAVLPDGKWIYGPQLVMDYRDREVLRDSFTGDILTKNQVAYLIENNPQLGLDLAVILLGRRQLDPTPIFDEELKQQFLVYIRNSVFAVGFYGNYNAADSARSDEALKTLMNYLTSTLSPRRYDVLMSLRVPNSNDTLGSVFAAYGTCITYAGERVAGVIWRECPEVTFDEFGPGLSGREHNFRFPRTPSMSPSSEGMPENETAIAEYYLRVTNGGERSVASLRR